MRIKILSSALEDLYEARLFYERQGVGYNNEIQVIKSITIYYLNKYPVFFT